LKGISFGMRTIFNESSWSIVVKEQI